MNEKRETMQLIHWQRRTGPGLADPARFGPEQAERVRRFHRSFPEYASTPLVRLDRLARQLGLGSIAVKDESFRFGLNAFKVLGGSWAIGNLMARRLGVEIGSLTCEEMTSPEIRKRLGELTFITATDGNHGRGVAWTARRLGQRSIVYMPRGSAPERLANIRALGSEVSITDLCYDDAVRLARREAEEKGYLLVQDTSWEGYETVPGWIMEGYTTMAAEAEEQLEKKPTHIFLQAGVGALAGAITGYYAAKYGDGDRPVIVIVEPNKADCIFRSAQAGRVQFVTTEMDTIMAGLACGEPCPLGWEQLRDHADHFLSIPDRCAARAMRVLGNPLAGNRAIVSGESGASTMGALLELMTDPALEQERERMGLDAHARVLLFSTEGDTDRENYRRIVWDGAFPSV